ncbi:MAG: TniQ family protein [Cellvibrionaceae bacterium]
MYSQLFPTPLQGVSSAEVESLPSYIHRAALEHGVSVGDLLRYVYRLGLKDHHVNTSVQLPSYVQTSDLVRSSRTSNMFRGLLEQYTSQDLSTSMLWVLEGVLSRSKLEVTKGFRWCPECFSEFLSLGKEPYFKLIWHMSAVSACPIHRTPLVEACEFCGSDQSTYRVKVPLGYCQSCGKSLSKRKRRLKAKDVRFSWEDIGLDIVQLFNDLAINGCELPESGPKQSLDDLFDYYWRMGREDEFYGALTRDESLAILYEQTPFSLKTARRVSYRLGVSLYDFLSGNAALTTDVLDSEMFCNLPPGYLEANKKTKRDHRGVLNKVKRYLREHTNPPSLAELARAVGVSTGYLEYRHPVLSKDVVVKHQLYLEHEKLRKTYRAQELALKFFLDEKYAKQPKSRKQAYRVLREETGLPKWVLKDAIQVAYRALN